jgi:hypothetical protein
VQPKGLYMKYMELYEKVKNGKDEYSYPFKQLASEDYYDCVTRIYRAFQSALESLDPDDVSLLNKSLESSPDFGEIPLKREINVIEDAKSIWEMVSSSISLLLSGRPAEAFEKIDGFFRADDGHYAMLIPVIKVPSDYLTMYRVRRSECSEQKKLFTTFHLMNDIRFRQCVIVFLAIRCFIYLVH